MKTYKNFLLENSNSKTIDIKKLISKIVDIYDIEIELKKLVLGKTCIWYEKGNRTLKKAIINEVKALRTINGTINVYFNGSSVYQDFMIGIEEDGINNENEIVGIPSGEVLIITKKQLKNLLDKLLIRYKNNNKFGWMYYFNDIDYYTIMKELNPNYTKPVKKNYFEVDTYKKGDVIVCKGNSGLLDINDRIGKIIDIRYGNGIDFLISFFVNFSNYLMNNNGWWIKYKNIKGIYKGDVEMQEILGEIQRNSAAADLEDHEIDDYYHIKSLFKNEEINIGDLIFLSNKKLCMFELLKDKFSDNELDVGVCLGKVMDKAIIKGFECVRADKFPNWYKNKCVTKKYNSNKNLKIGDVVKLKNSINCLLLDTLRSRSKFIDSNKKIGEKLGIISKIEEKRGFLCAFVNVGWYKLDCLEK